MGVARAVIDPLNISSSLNAPNRHFDSAPKRQFDSAILSSTP